MTKENNKPFYFILIIVVLVLIGFYLILNEINDLRNDVRNIEIAFEISNKGDDIISPKEATSIPTQGREADQSVGSGNFEEEILVIPTAIIFETLSSPLLSPQTKITVTVESISKLEDGTILINIKAFTNEATAYSALEPRDLFELLDLNADGITQKPFDIEGSFNSIPPKSAISGNIMFKIEPTKNSLILQVSHNGTIKYYELNFSKRSYKEAILG